MRLLALAWLLFAHAERLRVTVSPQAMLVDSYVRVTCHVPRDPDNRCVQFGIVEGSTSLRQLDGEAAPITWTLELSHAPCGAELAFCEVTRIGCVERVQAPLSVAGCD